MRVDIETMVGKTIYKIEGEVGDSEIQFFATDGWTYKFYHGQDCCESVWLEDIVGHLDDLLLTPILYASEECSDDADDKDAPLLGYEDSYTWTFYTLRTVKGTVTMRWYGTSNGYYSETADIDAEYTKPADLYDYAAIAIGRAKAEEQH